MRAINLFKKITYLVNDEMYGYLVQDSFFSVHDHSH